MLTGLPQWEACHEISNFYKKIFYIDCVVKQDSNCIHLAEDR